MQKPGSNSPQLPNLKPTFLRYLPERIEAIGTGWHSLSEDGWTVAKLAPLLQLVHDLAGLADKFGFANVHRSLVPLGQCFQTLVDTQQAPSAQQIKQIENLVVRLTTICHEDEHILEDSYLGAAEQWPQVFYLSGGEALAPGLADALTSLRCSLTHFNQPTELTARITKNPPAALVVDVNLLPQITGLISDNVIANTQPILVVLSVSNYLDAQLLALRTGAQAFFVTPIDAQILAAKINTLLTPRPEPSYRVLVMDDDVSQADFAVAILRKGGFSARAVTAPGQLLTTIEEFLPDLLLMDLYMPGVDGLELTRIIREYTAFASLPIVFMSGEQDADRQLDALLAGGDDFITKPIRPPRRLLTIVKSRILRARAIQLQTQSPDAVASERDPTTGLFSRSYLLAQLAATLASAGHQGLVHGLLCLEIDNWETIHQAIGPRQYDALLAAMGARFMVQLTPRDLCARINDKRIVLLAGRSQEQELVQLGETLVQTIAQPRFPISGLAAQPSVSAGLYLFNSAPEDALRLEQQAIAVCNLAHKEGGNRLLVQQALAMQVTKQLAKPKTEDILHSVRQALQSNQLQLIRQAFVALHDKQVQLHTMHWTVTTHEKKHLEDRDVLVVARQVIGLCRDLDRWLMGRTLDTLLEYRQDGKPGWLLVHQTMETIADPQFAAWLREELRRRLLVGTGLVIEFGLADIVKDVKGVKTLITELGVMGVEVCVGRFSRNEASSKVLRYLKPPFVTLSDKLIAAESAIINDLLEQIHRVDAKLIIPEVQDPDIIAKAWLTGADFAQAGALTYE